MSVEDIDIAAVFINSQALAVILEDIACMCCIAATGKGGYMAAGKAVRNCLADLLVGPNCTVCQPQVEAAVASLIIAGGNSLIKLRPVQLLSLPCNARLTVELLVVCFILPINP